VGEIHPSAAHWCTLSAALDELGWPWLRLHAELLDRRLAYRTYPLGHEIDWGDPSLRVDRAESTVTILETLPRSPPGEAWVMGVGGTTVAVEVLLPVGQRPPAATAVLPKPLQGKPTRNELKDAVEDAAEAYSSEDPPSFDEFWAALKIRVPGVTQAQVRNALKKQVPHLRRKRGQTRKIKSSG
jgi:hypothetical protein